MLPSDISKSPSSADTTLELHSNKIVNMSKPVIEDATLLPVIG